MRPAALIEAIDLVAVDQGGRRKASRAGQSFAIVFLTSFRVEAADNAGKLLQNIQAIVAENRRGRAITVECHTPCYVRIAGFVGLQADVARRAGPDRRE